MLLTMIGTLETLGRYARPCSDRTDVSCGRPCRQGAQMGIDEIVVLIMSGAYFICAGQVNASENIGVRSYSIWHDTHFLVQKEGLARLIRYKPKHFGRFTLFEAFSLSSKNTVAEASSLN